METKAGASVDNLIAVRKRVLALERGAKRMREQLDAMAENQRVYIPRFEATEREALEAAANTREILSLMTSAKTWSGRAYRWSKPFLAALVTLAVSKGLIGQGIADALNSLV